jgi:ribosome modulation factor
VEGRAVTDPAFTYAVGAVGHESHGLDLARGVMRDKRTLYLGRVVRSDGQVVWLAPKYVETERAALRLAQRQLAGLRAYLATNGRCRWDDEQARKALAKAREEARVALTRRLADAASKGVRARFAGQNTVACPYGLAEDQLRGVWLLAWEAAEGPARDNPAPTGK